MDNNYLEKNKNRKIRILKKESMKNFWLKEELKRRSLYISYNDRFLDKKDVKYIGILSKTPCRSSSNKFNTRRDRRKISIYKLYRDFDFLYPFRMNNVMFNNNKN